MDFDKIQSMIDAMPRQPAASPAPTPMSRLGKSLANLPGNIVSGLGSSAIALGEIGNPEGVQDKIEIPNFFDLAPPQGLGEKAVDITAGKGGLADTLIQSMVPAGILGKVGKAAGLAEGPGMEALKWAGGFAGPELNHEEATPTDVGVAGAFGAATGAMSVLPRKARIIPNLIASGLHGLYEGEQHGTEQGLVDFGLNAVIGSVLPQHLHAPEANIAELQGSSTGLSAGLEQFGPNRIEMPSDPDQFAAYKQQLATLQNEQAANQAQQAASRGSLKEGVRLMNGGNIPDQVDTGDFLRGYEASLPERGTAAGIVARRTELPFATLQREPDPILLSPPDLITGQETPQTQTHLMGDISSPTQRDWLSRGLVEMTPEEKSPLDLQLGESPTNPTTLFPVESFGSGPRTPADIAAMQKVQKLKRPRKARVVEPTIEPEDVTPEPEPATLSPDEIKYHKENFAKQSPEDLKGTMDFMDQQAADTLDPESKAHYYALKQLAGEALDKSTPAVEEAATAVAPKEAQSFKNNDWVTHRDIFGDEQHGTYKGKTPEGQAKVLFDEDKTITNVSHDKLSPKRDASIPELTTLQKTKAPIFTGEDEDFLTKWLREQNDLGELDENDPSNAGQDFKFETSAGPQSKFAKSESSLLEAAVKAVDKITAGIKDVISKHLDIKFSPGERFRSGVLANSGPRGEIEVNRDALIHTLDGWHNFSAAQKANSLGEVARWMGHEVGHTIFSFITAKDPRLMRKLIKEFEILGDAGREAIIKDFHDSMGLKDAWKTQYSSGQPWAMSEQYGFHPENVKAMQVTGVQEFFAEMSAAHIFGKLREEFLPPEMKSLWGKFKDLMKGVVDRLFNSSLEDVDQRISHENFKSIMTDMHERFSMLSKSDYEALQQPSENLYNKTIQDLLKRDSKIRQRVALEDFQAAQERIIQEERDAARGFVGDYEEDASYLPGDEFKFATSQNPTTQMQQKIVGNKGFIQSELARHLGSMVLGGAIGGYAAPRLSDQQMTVAEGVFAGAVLGFAGPIALRRMFMTMPQAGASTFQHMNAKEAFGKLFTLNELQSLGGDAATGQGSAPAMFVRWMERNLNLHLPQELFNAVIKAEGPASEAVQIASAAFEKARNFETTPAIDNAVAKYLRGGVVSDLRQVLGTDAKAQEFGNFIVTGRESIGLLQEMVASGLKDGAFKSKVLQSLQDGDYLTRQYRMFNDVDYKPTQDQIENIALELSHANLDYDLSTSRQIIEDYFHQIQVDRGMFSGGKGDIGQKLDAAIFQRKNDRLSIAMRDALGEYKDPKEQLMGTIRHLYTNAISSKFYDQVASMTNSDGLKMSLSREEHGSLLDSIKAKLLHPAQGATPEEIATLQKQKQALQYYVPLENAPKYGKLGGKMVNRFVRDQLASFDNPWGVVDGSIMRTLSKFHNNIKIGRTALNPITVIRNIVAAPVLMGLARANPIHALPGGAAWEAMRSPTSALGREMLHQGIFGVDQVRSEFFRTADQILTGDFDHSGLSGIFKQGMNKVLEFYRAPDILVRGATYVSAKGRFAEKFNLPLDDIRVIDAARDWTNRYTVNYQNVAPIVKSLRQIPFSNLFISYTAELTRIAKNLTMDIFQHPDQGQRVFAAGALGGLSALPFLLEKGSVNNLSQKDQEEWKKSQAQMPDYSRSRFRVVLGKEGNRFRYLDITPILQIDSLLQAMRTVGTGDIKGFLATNPVFGWENTPAANIIAQQITGTDLHTGRPIDTTVTTRLQSALKEIVPPIVPGGYEYQKVSDALSQTDTGDRGVTNLRTGRTTTPGEIVTSFLTGMNLTTVDTAYLHRNTIADAKRQIANEASYLRDIAATNLPKQAKDKAVARYQSAVGGILQDMQSKLNGQVP